MRRLKLFASLTSEEVRSLKDLAQKEIKSTSSQQQAFSKKLAYSAAFEKTL
jgi:hypothetical protein